LIDSSGQADSSPGVNRTLIRILALLCIACGLLLAFIGLDIGIAIAGLAAMMRDPSLAPLIIVVPLAAGLPFIIVGVFLFWFKPWARRGLVVLLMVALLPLAAIIGNDVVFEGFPPLELGATFAFLAAVLVLAVSPGTRRAFGRTAGRWWLEAGLAAVLLLGMFGMSVRGTISAQREHEAAEQQTERDRTEFTKLLETPESPETAARLGQLMSARAYLNVRGTVDSSALTLAAKNHPDVFKALLDASSAGVEPIVWKYLAENGHFEALPDATRYPLPDPKLAEQFGVELIRIIREDRNDPGFRERVTGLIRGGADLRLIDQNATALEEAMRTGHTGLEDLLRRQLNWPIRGPIYGERADVKLWPQIYDFHERGPCPKTVVFKAEFTLNNPETIQYRFTDETLTLRDTQEFKAEVGRNTVSLKRVLGVPGQRSTGWVQFELTAGGLHLTTGQNSFALDCH
jgi:hypothetical protein